MVVLVKLEIDCNIEFGGDIQIYSKPKMMWGMHNLELDGTSLESQP